MKIAIIIAFLFLLAGLLLCIGCTTDYTVSFPLAGILFMVIGGMIGKAARQ